MYRDLENLNLIGIKDDEEAFKYNVPCLRIGFAFCSFLIQAYRVTWDQSFYIQCGIDFEKRWSQFHIRRDSDSELDLYSRLNPNNEPYALIHGFASDGIQRIDDVCIDPSLKRIEVKPEYSHNIFDYSILIEKARELHCVDSSFKHICESLETSQAKLFYHNKLNPKPVLSGHISKKDWQFV